MSIKMKDVFVTLVLSLLVISACAKPQTEGIIEQATVVADRASLRQKNTSTSRTLQVLRTGEKVDILERDGNWFRVRYSERLQGWMEESTLVTNSMRARVQKMVVASQNLRPQNTGTMRETANFRIEPGRSTSVIRRLESGTKVEVLDRVTAPRPGSTGSSDVWLKVRPSPMEIGWIFAGLLEFDTPADIARYTEGLVYPAVKVLNRVQDSISGPINWYVAAERGAGLDPNLDFDGIRVFTWNMRLHRYETAFRMKGFRGVYPLEVSQEDGNPAFHFNELSENGSAKMQRNFVMRGVVVREVKAIS